jgi:WD40 repeat protein
MYIVSAHSGPVLSVAVSPDGRIMASSGDDRMIRIWDLHPGGGNPTARTSRQWTVASAVLTFSHDGTTLASGLTDGSVQLWKVGAELQEGLKSGPIEQPSHALAYSPDGALLACGTKNGVVMLNAVTCHPVWSDSFGLPAGEVDFSEGGETLAVAGRKAARLYEVTTGKLLPYPDQNPAGVAVLTISFQHGYGHLLACGGQDGKVTVHDPAAQQIQAEFPRLDQVDWVAFSPNGRLLGAADRSGRLTFLARRNLVEERLDPTKGLLPPRASDRPHAASHFTARRAVSRLGEVYRRGHFVEPFGE